MTTGQIIFLGMILLPMVGGYYSAIFLLQKNNDVKSWLYKSLILLSLFAWIIPLFGFYLSSIISTVGKKHKDTRHGKVYRAIGVIIFIVTLFHYLNNISTTLGQI
jgi:drug/metabolite transporter superfamily protein YnfA